MSISWLHSSDNLDVAYLPAAQMTVHMASTGQGAQPSAQAVKPAMPRKKEMGGGASGKDAPQPWGDSNDYPQRLIEQYSKDPIIPETFAKKTAMVNMNDVIPFQVIGYNADNSEIVQWVNDPEINTFLNNVSNKRYLREGTSDLVWLYNAFPELIMSRDRKRILYIAHQEAAYCRYQKMNDRGEIEWVHINANWPNVVQNDPLTIKRRCLDPYRYDRIDWARQLSEGSFIYPINIPTPGRDYYQLPTHDSIRTSGWLDVHLMVPAFKKAMMQNEMSLKYHLKVDVKYWEHLHGKEAWDKYSPAEKRAKKREWLTEMTDTLTSADKAGLSIMTERKWLNGEKAQYQEFLEIVAVTDHMKEGKYIQDGLEAAANLFYALGIDPTIVGFAGGDKMGARSGGSDKREAWLILMHMLNVFRDPLLEPYYYAAEFNGWTTKYPNLKFRHRDVILTTLDTGAGTKKVLS
ncbi:hypothetical protein [Telluribacter humicola]|uniref:hypothetical protein n=1 Tax=Telluribacter humicola TaxID=1720261 RepID=UPI001A95CFE1|nr:hypothetical protein [Telluribacter humicola]